MNYASYEDDEAFRYAARKHIEVDQGEVFFDKMEPDPTDEIYRNNYHAYHGEAVVGMLIMMVPFYIGNKVLEAEGLVANILIWVALLIGMVSLFTALIMTARRMYVYSKHTYRWRVAKEEML